MERTSRGRWQTHWRLVAFVGEERVCTVERTFTWAPLSDDRAAALLATCGLELREEFSGYDRAPYVPGQSKARLVVESAA